MQNIRRLEFALFVFSIFVYLFGNHLEAGREIWIITSEPIKL